RTTTGSGRRGLGECQTKVCRLSAYPVPKARRKRTVLQKGKHQTQLEPVKEPTMTKIEKVLYTAKTHTTGGREGGASRSDDGRLDVKVSPPGTSGTGTNPEQLFAAGWSTCFLSSIKIVAGKAKVKLPAEMAIDAEVDLGMTGSAYSLAARL